MPKLRIHGKAIGAASNTDENAAKVMALYSMLYGSFDPMTMALLEEALDIYVESL